MSRAASWPRPSPGFCAIVLSYALSCAFFAWGLSTPPLDRVWQLHHQLETGALYTLSGPDRALLTRELEQHEALAEALLSSGQIGVISAQRDGWIETPEVTIVRTPRSGATKRLRLEVQTPLEHIPYHVTLQGPGWRREQEVQARGPLELELPPPAPLPELLTLSFKGPGLRADPSSLAVRVSFDPAPAAAAADPNDDEERTEPAERKGPAEPEEPAERREPAE